MSIWSSDTRSAKGSAGTGWIIENFIFKNISNIELLHRRWAKAFLSIVMSCKIDGNN